MDKLKDSFFQAYFSMPVPRIIVRTNEPHYTIVAVNKAYTIATGVLNDTIAGKTIFDLFTLRNTGPGNRVMLADALHNAVKANDTVIIPEFELSSTIEQSNLPSWWQIEILPVAEEGEKPAYIILTTTDITLNVLDQRALIEAGHREQTLQEELAATNEELAASNEELSATVEHLRRSQESLLELNETLEDRVRRRTEDLFIAQGKLAEQYALLGTIVNEVPAGICVFRGPEMIIDTVNTTLLSMWRRGRDIIGHPLEEIMPEIKTQEFPSILAEVFQTGIPYSRYDALAELILDGVKQTVYRDYSYTPLKNTDGTTHSILAMTVDVTERTLSRLREQELIEEQSAINEELAAANEELAVTNEELHESQEAQQELIVTLAESESRFRNLIMEAPVAISVLNGNSHVLEAVNDEGLKLLGRTRDIVGKPLREGLPELEHQPFLALLDSVYESGEICYGNEVAASFEQGNKTVSGYHNFIFKPLKGNGINVDGIMVVSTEVTDLVNARKERENAETKLGLAIEAAQMGSWHIDRKTKALNYNSTLASLFGYEGDEPMTYEQAINQVTDDFRDKLIEEIEKAITEGGDYDVTYTQRRFNDNEIIWLRSLGKITLDEQGNHSIFSGVVMNVTEQKKDEQRKNDFIGMVSHELKTPLTALNGYTQLLQARAKKNEDGFSEIALGKVTEQVKKMTTLINGFLNISRLESGKIHLNKRNFNLDELVAENIKETEMLTGSHEIIFESCGAVGIFADREKIGSVISNMISNAVKYSPDGKTVEVRCEVSSSSATISVKDQGMGISKEDLPRLFDRFYRVENNQTKLISGFGIGLYLSAEIVESHKGRIWVESEPGRGSTFYFSLPLLKNS